MPLQRVQCVELLEALSDALAFDSKREWRLGWRVPIHSAGGAPCRQAGHPDVVRVMEGKRRLVVAVCRTMRLDTAGRGGLIELHEEVNSSLERGFVAQGRKRSATITSCFWKGRSGLRISRSGIGLKRISKDAHVINLIRGSVEKRGYIKYREEEDGG